MIEDINTQNSYSLKGLINIIKSNFKFLFFFSALFSCLSLMYSIALDDIYTSESLLSPVKSIRDNQPSISGGSIGALVGLGVGGSSGSSNKTVLALEVLETKNFFKSFYLREDFLLELSAAKEYQKSSQKLIYDESMYMDGEWVEGKRPNLQKAHRDFMDLLTIDHDRLDGFVVIKVDHVSPYVAKKWLTNIIKELNLYIKLKDVNEAEKSVKFLEKQITLTKKVDLKTIFSSMLIQQYETIMLSEITDEFVFEILDEPRVPDKKSKPGRAFITIFLSLSGAFLLLILVLFLNASGRRISLKIFPPSIKLESIN